MMFFTPVIRACGTMLLVVAMIGSELLAADWPQLRGSTHDGHSVEIDITDSWPPEGPPVLWAKEIGAGYSGFAVVEDRAFTLAQSLHQQFVLCLDANTGETIWTHRYALPFEGGLYPGPRSTPTVSGDRVVYATPDGVIGCVRASDGGSVWDVPVHRRFRDLALGVLVGGAAADAVRQAEPRALAGGDGGAGRGAARAGSGGRATSLGHPAPRADPAPPRTAPAPRSPRR